MNDLIKIYRMRIWYLNNKITIDDDIYVQEVENNIIPILEFDKQNPALIKDANTDILLMLSDDSEKLIKFCKTISIVDLAAIVKKFLLDPVENT